MALVLRYYKHTLKFKFDAGTSRGVLREKDSWFVKVFEQNHPDVYGVGECGPLPGLSIDTFELIEGELGRIALAIASMPLPASNAEALHQAELLTSWQFPAVRFALETALLDLINEGQGVIIKNRFVASGDPLPINGLIWMGDAGWMREQVARKIEEGYACIKLKVGAIDFEQELDLLAEIRKSFNADKITLRVDANGAFATNEVLFKLQRLAEYDLHSIEQPIMPRQMEAMQLICSKSKVPVALDEELIGVNTLEERRELLEFIRPQYIVLKPSLLGGIASTRQWIALANELNIGWWITSALESNIGLNSICQLTADYHIATPQGLGTGQLYHNNVASPLVVGNGYIHYDRDTVWQIPSF